MRTFRPIPFLVTLLVFVAAADAQSDVPRPVAGKSIVLHQKQTKVQPTKDGPMTMVAEVPITVTVLQADAQRTVIRWQRGVLKITDVDNEIVRKNPAVKPMLLQAAVAMVGPIISAMDDLAFDLMFSPNWDYLGLANYDQALAGAKKSLDAMDEMRRKNGGKPLEPAMREAMLNRKIIEQVFPKEALTYLAGQTYAVRRGATAAFTGKMPNPLGADPVASRTQVTFDQANDANGHAVIHTASTVEMDQWVASLKQMIAKAPSGKALSAEDEQKMRQMQLEWNAEYRIDPATGLPTWAQYTTSAKGPTGEMTEVFLWTGEPR